LPMADGSADVTDRPLLSFSFDCFSCSLLRPEDRCAAMSREASPRCRDWERRRIPWPPPLSLDLELAKTPTGSSYDAIPGSLLAAGLLTAAVAAARPKLDCQKEAVRLLGPLAPRTLASSLCCFIGNKVLTAAGFSAAAVVDPGDLATLANRLANPPAAPPLPAKPIARCGTASKSDGGFCCLGFCNGGRLSTVVPESVPPPPGTWSICLSAWAALLFKNQLPIARKPSGQARFTAGLVDQVARLEAALAE